MKKWRFNSMLSKKALKHGCELSKSTDSLSPIENTRKREDSSVNDREKKSQSWRNSYLFSYSNVDQLFRVTDIRNFNSDETFLLIDSKGDSYSIYFDIENNIFEIDNDHAFSTFYDTKYNWNNYINNSIDNYLYSQIRVGSSILSGSENYIDNPILSYILSEGRSLRTITNDSNLTKRENLDVRENLDLKEKIRNLWVQCDNCYFLNYKKFFAKIHLNICEECGYHLKMSSSDRIELLIDPGTWNPMDEDMVSVDPLGFHWTWNPMDEDEDMVSVDPLEFHSEMDEDEDMVSVGLLEFNCTWNPMDEYEAMVYVDPLEFHSEMDEDEDMVSVDPLHWTWNPMDEDEDMVSVDPLEFHSEMDEDMVSVDPLEFHSEEEPYKDRINFDQIKTGLTEAVQTGIGQLYGIPVAIGVMDFEFIGGSMGSVVGEKITRLIEYASNKLLPLIIVCASGGARMQEGSLSLMQMAKIASVLYDYQSNKRLFYVSILTSPTTGGVTASFGMLGDIIIAEPNAYIAFAGKRIIEQILNETVPEGSQEAEYLFHKGLFDPIVPRNLLKGVLSELFQLHAFFPVKKINKVEN
uniref:acetyl-CoA carboxylase subunit beta n=1 Tax=Silene alexandrae TaxID=2764675 RepID=UPI00279A878C|nr:acetyl-CoA carboxylase subunit beta [Silene alexandrae]WFF48090.1 acetyl-CoA carboxylase subunit beta [Silene alexandrae]